MKNWLRNKMIQWLGIGELMVSVEDLYKLNSNLVSIGVDWHYKEPTTIIILSKIKGGQVRHIETPITDMHELNTLTRRLKDMYRTDLLAEDLPPGMKF